MRSEPTGSSDAGAGDAPALDLFALRDSVVDEYKRFATSFTTIRAPDIREQVEAIYAGNRYWPEPLIQINPSYKRSTDVGALVADGVLDPGCADVFRAKGRPPVPLQAPGAGHRARRGRRELHGDDRHGIREVALLLHPHRRPCSARTAHERHRRLPDERARELPDGGARQVHRAGAGRPADHVRPLHGAGRRRRAETGRGRTPGHPPHQLHAHDRHDQRRRPVSHAGRAGGGPGGGWKAIASRRMGRGCRPCTRRR